MNFITLLLLFVGAAQFLIAQEPSSDKIRVLYKLDDETILQTQDSGKTWIELFSTLEDVVVLAWTPLYPEKLLAATEQGIVYQMDSGGKTWIPVFVRDPGFIVQKIGYTAKNSHSILLVETDENGTDQNVFCSINGGVAWAQATTSNDATTALLHEKIDAQIIWFENTTSKKGAKK